MAGINLKYRIIEKILKDNGFTFVRQSGDHKIYKRGKDHISLPCPKVNGLILERLFKEHNIKVR